MDYDSANSKPFRIDFCAWNRLMQKKLRWKLLRHPFRDAKERHKMEQRCEEILKTKALLQNSPRDLSVT
jgi:hypothetical protein